MTPRLTLRELAAGDAGFILRLVNEPSWLQHIGDRHVHSLDDARAFIASGPAAMYQREGFGLYRVGLRSDDTPIGICGLIRRPQLSDVDIGFALLPEYCGCGYAREAAAATLALARERFGLRRVVAITTTENHRSAHLLEQLGLRFERPVVIDPGKPPLRLFSIDLEARAP